jgi:tRNA1Val (adenine37-N6)-methyltransferase
MPGQDGRRRHRRIRAVLRSVAMPEHDAALERALLRRPPGWRAPGPPPARAQGRPELAPGPDEDLSFLVGDWRIFQLRRGHRWSLDDFATAYVALQTARAHEHVAAALDLGCGIGSVLLMVAWGLPTARVVGVEAQARSVELGRRSLAYDGADDRCEIRLGDLRDEALLPEPGPFDLVTGTPPYLPIGTGLVSERAQRGPCCFETRGGLEDYCLAAARALARGGAFVVCSGAQDPAGRAQRAAEAAGLAIYRSVEVIPKEGKDPLFYVHVMGEPGGAPWAEQSDAGLAASQRSQFVSRCRDGSRHPDMQAARAFMGLPPAR